MSNRKRKVLHIEKGPESNCDKRGGGRKRKKEEKKKKEQYKTFFFPPDGKNKMKKPGLNSGKTEAANGYSQQSLNKLHRTQYINIDYTHHRHQKELTRNRICDINMYIYIYMYVCMYVYKSARNK